MKKLIGIMGAAALMVTALAAPALGAAQNVPLEPATTAGNPPGGGFVVFNDRDSSAGPNNLLITVSLKNVLPNTAYDVYLFVGGTATADGTKLGTVTTNGQGNAVFPAFADLDLGAHALGIDVTLAGDLADVYLSDGFYPNLSTTLNFK